VLRKVPSRVHLNCLPDVVNTLVEKTFPSKSFGGKGRPALCRKRLVEVLALKKLSTRCERLDSNLPEVRKQRGADAFARLRIERPKISFVGGNTSTIQEEGLMTVE